jgi:hypothetical protein
LTQQFQALVEEKRKQQLTRQPSSHDVPLPTSSDGGDDSSTGGAVQNLEVAFRTYHSVLRPMKTEFL